MSKRDRTTLKAFFREGALPGAEEYRDLIDSAVNQVDDGFDKTNDDGLKLTSVGDARALLSFYRGLGASAPDWQISHAEEAGTLHVRAGAGSQDIEIGGEQTTLPDAPGLALNRKGRVGVNNGGPDWELDVAGTARMSGRIGYATKDITQVPADRRWHDITPVLTGCHAFEVMAGAGGKVGQGRYSMLHAIAMNAYQPRNWFLNWVFGRRSIRKQTAMYGSFADRLQLRWASSPGQHNYRLQIRSNANFGDTYTIRYYLTRLWFDTTMEGSRQEDVDRDEDLR